MVREVPERDWKVLCELKPLALARYCDRVLDEVIALASDRASGSHARYLAIFQLIAERNDTLAAAFDDLSRSKALPKLTAMRRLGLFKEEEFSRFGDETRRRVQALLDA